MSKFYASLALLSLLSGLPALAADTSTTTDASKSETSAPAPVEKGGKHGGHDHIAGRKAVLGITSLTDKQKEQINAVYDANKAKYDDIEKQRRELMKDEWTKIKPVLTADQLTELRQEHRKHAGGGAGAGKAAPSGKGAAAAADSGSDKSSQ